MINSHVVNTAHVGGDIIDFVGDEFAFQFEFSSCQISSVGSDWIVFAFSVIVRLHEPSLK